jgi:hypothetical protein
VHLLVLLYWYITMHGQQNTNFCPYFSTNQWAVTDFTFTAYHCTKKKVQAAWKFLPVLQTTELAAFAELPRRYMNNEMKFHTRCADKRLEQPTTHNIPYACLLWHIKTQDTSATRHSLHYHISDPNVYSRTPFTLTQYLRFQLSAVYRGRKKKFKMKEINGS